MSVTDKEPEKVVGQWQRNVFVEYVRKEDGGGLESVPVRTPVCSGENNCTFGKFDTGTAHISTWGGSALTSSNFKRIDPMDNRALQ